MPQELLRQAAVWLPALLLSLTVHEYAHAWVATRLGDRTPRQEGRLTLDPTSHVDPIGTLLFPAILLFASNGATTFGWARPVRFDPSQFTRRMDMRRGAALTAIAGPLSNVLLAFLAGLLYALLVSFGVLGASSGAAGRMAREFLAAMFQLNVLLAVFNALPLPPLDGSHLLPRSMDEVRETLTRFAPILFLLLFFGIPGVLPAPGLLVLRPLQAALSGVLAALVRLIVG